MAGAGGTQTERDTSLDGIDLHLLDEGVEGRKPAFVAQSSNEIDTQDLAVEIAGKIERVDLEQRFDAIDGRTRTETRDRGSGTTA